MTAFSTQFLIDIFAVRAVLKRRSRPLAKPLYFDCTTCDRGIRLAFGFFAQVILNYEEDLHKERIRLCSRYADDYVEDIIISLYFSLFSAEISAFNMNMVFS